MDLQPSQIDFEILVELGRPFSDSWKMVVPSPKSTPFAFLEEYTIDSPVYALRP
jgi:hypothetical protein